MDNANIIQEINNGIIAGSILMFILIVLVLTLTIVYYKNKTKKHNAGFQFEKSVEQKIKEYAKSNNFKFIGPSLFSYNEKYFFEIDGLLITPKVVFIIESKYYEGRIKGNALSNDIELINKKFRRKFKNPIQQNFNHIQHFYRMVGQKFNMFSLVIFPNKSVVELENLKNWNIIANLDNIEITLNEVLSNKNINELENIEKDIIKTINSCIKENRNKKVPKFKNNAKK
ncbi:nuclease-related domain-containing protein [Mycoplasmopsis meleagridis]|uniref:nuclease-related domain-containing protein n=1 Tax=Mycoplasmopsis meleagridis TaxID=29561 RepID=UPI000B0C354F|nr:nuclease-related domain-containing protein [Mycoplasmopsis meleagridis]